MNELLVGNAPCSWGTLEHQDQSQAIPSTQMLDELVETGYTGTELGDWGYMPTDPVRLSEELTKRNNVAMLGAFVPVELKNPLAHAEGTARAVRTARLIAAVATTQAPFLVLADDNGTDARRTKLAGRVPASAGLNKDEWKTFAGGADRIARAVFDETGLRTVFHHHCAGYVETPDEIATLLDVTNPERLGLVFDAGHYVHGTGMRGDRPGGRAQPLQGAHLVHPFERYRSQRGAPHPRGRVGLLHGNAKRPVSRTGQRMRRLPCPVALACGSRLQGIRAGGAGYSAGDGHAEGERQAQPGVYSVD